jgi:tetratricopeptide (TPR) repeat protein
MLRGEIEWLAASRDSARAFYRTAVDLLYKPASDLSAGNHAGLALAQARLGHPDEAIRESNEAIMLFRRADDRSGELQSLPDLARMKLVLGDPAAAIDLLAQVLGQRGTGYLSPALLRVDPSWDPIRNDPRFQALLKDHADPKRDSAGSGGKP